MKALKAERSGGFKGSFYTIIDIPCNSEAKREKVKPFSIMDFFLTAELHAKAVNRKKSENGLCVQFFYDFQARTSPDT